MRVYRTESLNKAAFLSERTGKKAKLVIIEKNITNSKNNEKRFVNVYQFEEDNELVKANNEYHTCKDKGSQMMADLTKYNYYIKAYKLMCIDSKRRVNYETGKEI